MKKKQVEDLFRDQLGGQLSNQLWDQLRGHFEERVGVRLVVRIWVGFKNQPATKLWGQVRGGIWSLFLNQIKKQAFKNKSK